MDTIQELDRGERRKRRHRRSKEHKPHSRFVAFLASYWFETSAALIFVAGVFLLLERLQIKTTVYLYAVWILAGSRDVAWNAVHGTANFLGQFETSDLVGMVLILTAFAMVLNRARSRAIDRSLSLIDGSPCPKCGDALRRVRRKNARERLLQTILRVRIRSYACRKCSFQNRVWESRL